MPSILQESISQRKLEANRRNAQRSTGPRTAEGKARSRCNALRHGLRSEEVLFGSDHRPADPELQAVYEGLQQHYGRDEGDLPIGCLRCGSAGVNAVTALTNECDGTANDAHRISSGNARAVESRLQL